MAGLSGRPVPSATSAPTLDAPTGSVRRSVARSPPAKGSPPARVEPLREKLREL